MSVRIQLAGTALARVRFAVSPVFETVMALDVLRRPGAHAVHLPWVAQVRPSLGQIPDLPLLQALLRYEGKPGFLMPVPDDRMPDLATELRRVRATPARQLRRDLDWLSDRLPPPLRALYDDPRAGLSRVAAAVRACHQALIAPYWPRIVRLLEADIAYRAGTLTDGGVAAVFADLHRQVAWTDGELMLHPEHRPAEPVTVRLSGHGLVLSPSVFCWPRTWAAVRPVAAGIVRYPARGLAALWETRGPAPDALAALLGRTRAALLELLAEPATTADLSARLAVTAGGVSQHLGVLRAAGLVATRRDGRTVLHLRTDRADALLGHSSPAVTRSGSPAMIHAQKVPLTAD
jgi:DNA-binding transcriptional ArsR family regulator